MKCIIVDDEPLAVDLLETYLQRMNDVEVIGTTNDAIEAISMIKNNPVDLVFLDIEMPNLTGLELVKSLNQLPQFIFTTAYPQYALEGYELNATDYLLKPISFSRLVKAVGVARDFYDLKQQAANATTPELDFIFVKSEYENVKIKISAIIYIEGLKDYIKIYLKGSQKTVLTLMSFKAILDKLPATFLRIHRSYIVNIDYVDAHQKNKLIIDAKRLPIGETFKEEVMNRLGLN